MKKFTKKLTAFLLASALVTTMMPATTSQARKKGIKLNKTNITLYVGNTSKLKVNGTKAKAAFKSTNKKVVSVSKKGILKAKKVGSAKIIAKVSGKKLTCKVKVAPMNKSGLYSTTNGKFISWNRLIEIGALSVSNETLIRIDETLINVPAFSLVIDSRIEKIGTCAFSSCDHLVSVKLPKNLSTIENSAFLNCSRLKAVSIPNSVNVLGANAFAGCSRLSRVKLSNNLQEISSSCFQNCVRLKKISLAHNVTKIGSGAFENCKRLKSVKSASGVCIIEVNAFSQCKSLTSITLPNSLSSIENYAFSGCKKLNLKVPNSVISIGSAAFHEVKHVSYSGTAQGSPWGARSYN